MKKLGIPLGILGISCVIYFVLVGPKTTVKSAAAPIQASPVPLKVEEIKPSPPLVRPDAPAASISARSFVVYDVTSGQIIAAKEPNLRLMPASTTKMMTALIALQEYNPVEVVTLSRATAAIGHTIDFVPGEQITVLNMIKAMLINSGNDAAIALADHHPAGYDTFVKLMNQKAVSWGLKDTHFSNVSGVEADDHYSTASDLAVIANELMKNDVLREIVDTKTAIVKTVDGKISHRLENLNKLLWDVPGVIGIKTGWTEVAGDCLVTYIHRDHDIITVVLKSDDRFKDSSDLIKWSYANINW